MHPKKMFILGFMAGAITPIVAYGLERILQRYLIGKAVEEVIVHAIETVAAAEKNQQKKIDDKVA